MRPTLNLPACAVVALLCTLGCQPDAGGTAADAAAAEPPVAALRTTDGAIALGNLDAQVRGLERLAQGGPQAAAAQRQLVDLLGARAQYRAGVADRSRALALADALVAGAPDDPQALLARAAARGGLHGFRAALADAERAAALGAPAEVVEAARAGLLQSLGRYDEALAIRRAHAERAPDTATLGALATLLAERGEHAAAVDAFARARAAYGDVSPFPLAWLQFEEGLMWMRAGDLARAHAHFTEAHTHLPGYVAARCHLAEVEAALGRPQVAVALLEPLAAAGEDPDPAAQLARILAEQGDAAGAARWRARAAARYDELLARYPDAFADHGTEFYLAAGDDPARALALARHNAGIRRSAGALDLLLTAAAAAADDASDACAVARDAASAGDAPALQAVRSRAAALCG